MPQITGKALYEVLPHFQGWLSLRQDRQQFYNAMAEKLNACYLVPLQGELERQMKAFHILRETLCEATDFFDKKEAELQQDKKVLQGLVREYQLLAHESLSIESNGDLCEWRDHKDALDDQAVALLNDERKEG